jgi:hypothetical protein
MRKKFWLEMLEGRYNSEELGVNGKIILKSLLRNKGGRLVHWISLAHDSYRWLSHVNLLTDSKIPLSAGHFLTS